MQPPTDAAEPPAITLRDSSRYQGQVYDGSMALLYKGDQFVDSVDLAFGAWAVGVDSLLFLPVRAYTVAGDERGIEITRHVLLAGTHRTLLDSLLPYFNSGFSSPTVAGRHVHYWGLRRLAAGGEYELYAARYVVGAGQVDTISLGKAGLYTDARFHLPPPTADGRYVRFQSDSGTFLVDSAFRTARRLPLR